MCNANYRPKSNVRGRFLWSSSAVYTALRALVYTPVAVPTHYKFKSLTQKRFIWGIKQLRFMVKTTDYAFTQVYKDGSIIKYSALSISTLGIKTTEGNTYKISMDLCPCH